VGELDKDKIIQKWNTEKEINESTVFNWVKAGFTVTLLCTW
jgi:hypothetical protein